VQTNCLHAVFIYAFFTDGLLRYHLPCLYRECNINTVEVATVEEFALTAFISSLKKYIAIYRFDKKESQSGFNFSPAIKHFV